MKSRLLACSALLAAACCACADPERAQLEKTTIPTYDKTTGKLTELTYDMNKNGKIDTWTQMDGARPVLTRMDRNEDGIIDRWEYFDADAKLVKVGFSRTNADKPDAWAFGSPDGKQIYKVEISSTADEKKIDRWERYGPGNIMQEADEDTDGDGRPDKWETYVNGAVRTVAFDENKDGRPDRRFTYQGAVLVQVETEPDSSGKYTKVRPMK
jgi:hypothetical protein